MYEPTSGPIAAHRPPLSTSMSDKLFLRIPESKIKLTIPY